MNQIIIDVTGNHLQAILPVLILAVFGLLILCLDMFQKGGSRQYLAWVAITGFVSAFVAAWVLWQNQIPRSVFAEMAYMDGFTQAFTCIFTVAGILTCLLAREYLKSHDMDRGEFYVILLFAVLGMIIVASAADMMMVFLGIETMSISAYVLAAFFRKEKRSAEAGLKYLILGAMATGFLLYGTALVYGVTGTTNLHEIGEIFSGEPAELSSQAQSAISTETMVETYEDDEAFDTVQEHIAEMNLVAAAEEINNVRREHQIRPESRVPVMTTRYSQELMPLAFLGMLLILIAFGFKIAAVPFHMWAPDVYEGAPTPVVGFMATAVKAAGFAGLLRVLMLAFFDDFARNSATGWVQILFALAILTMIVGNFAAIVQDKLKRMLAYSSIAHAGYVLVAVVAAGFAKDQAMFSAVIFYLVAYTFATIGAFGVLSYFGRRGEEVGTYEDLNGLGHKHPWAGFAMVVFMLSAAGIPPTAGFVAKFFVFKAAVEAGAAGGSTGKLLIVLACVGVLASVAGVYYYLRVIVHMYMKDATRVIRPLVGWATTVALIICVAGTVFLGVLPGRLERYSRLAAARVADTPGQLAEPFADDSDNDDFQVWRVVDE